MEIRNRVPVFPIKKNIAYEEACMKKLEQEPAQQEVSTRRLETLTDGIFALAMTLLFHIFSVCCTVAWLLARRVMGSEGNRRGSLAVTYYRY